MLKIFNMIFVIIYIFNISEILGNRLRQTDKKKEVIGLEILQIIIISSYTSFLILKGGLK